jgi:hypothetical protein
VRAISAILYCKYATWTKWPVRALSRGVLNKWSQSCCQIHPEAGPTSTKGRPQAVVKGVIHRRAGFQTRRSVAALYFIKTLSVISLPEQYHDCIIGLPSPGEARFKGT